MVKKKSAKTRRKKITATVILLLFLVTLIAAGSLILLKSMNRKCLITQYADMSGNQGSFYTIQTPSGQLIVVDGGYAQNADYVRSVIEENGNKVDAWIITHPHPDHVGAFNTIWENPGDLEVADLYTIEMDYNSYRERAEEWDDFGSYETFLRLTEGFPDLHYLHTGDELKLCGLQIKVLSAYNKEITNSLTSDLANDGSLMFKVTNKEESMLFCADVGVKISDSIIAGYKEDLKSDYLQMGHHGNGGLSEEFYRLVEPKAAFFDAPDWLMNPEDPESTWTTPHNRALMEIMGARIYAFSTAPNQIQLK